MLLKSNYYVENLEIPESGPELPPPALHVELKATDCIHIRICLSTEGKQFLS